MSRYRSVVIEFTCDFEESYCATSFKVYDHSDATAWALAESDGWWREGEFDFCHKHVKETE